MIFMSCVFIFGGQISKAQLVRQKSESVKSQANLDWYNCSPEKDGIFGADINRAYEFLKGKKVKHRPVIAVVGGGLDIEHEALKSNIWTDKREKEDGKDNDKDGYIDDIHGWNFIGGKDGRVMEYTLREGDREFMRLKDKWGRIIHNKGQFFSYADGKKVVINPPEDMDEYFYYRNRVMYESPLAGAYGGTMLGYIVQEYAGKVDKEMRVRFPEKTTFTAKELAACWDPNGEQDTLANLAMNMLGYAFGFSTGKDWDAIYKSFMADSYIEQTKNTYKNLYDRSGNDQRKEIVGDDYLDINDRVYGNNVLLTSNAGSGTMMAGIIAGKRGVEGRNNPISEVAEIMPIVISGAKGESYLKDVALAIRYAVDHKADVIILPQQNSFYPEAQKIWVSEAIRYAEQKGVLVIVPAWELSYDLSLVTFYPNRWMDGKEEMTNLMVISSSDKNGNPSMKSSFGEKEVDMYAPGIDILSTYTGDTYQSGSGVMLATSMVAGVAALVKSYYPELTGAQIRTILLESVTSRKGIEVEKEIRVAQQVTQDLFLFEQLCLSAGILNAYNALVVAEKMKK